MTKTTDTPAVATLEIMRALAAQTPFNRFTRTEALVCEGGKAELAIPFGPDLAQHHGYLHGGLIGYLADTAMSWAAASLAGDVLTAEFRIHLLAPGIGERFIGRGEVLKQGRRQIVSRGEVYAVKDGVEKLIAVGTGTILPVGR